MVCVVALAVRLALVIVAVAFWIDWNAAAPGQPNAAPFIAPATAAARRAAAVTGSAPDARLLAKIFAAAALAIGSDAGQSTHPAASSGAVGMIVSSIV
jgi:hypothetical protein